MSAIVDLGNALSVSPGSNSPPAQLSQGVVTAVDGATGTLTIILSGDTANPVVGISPLKSYGSPTVSDTVWLLKSATDRLALGPVGLSGGGLTDPVTTASAGTATSGTTETRDDVLSTYAFTADGTSWFEAVVAGLVGNSRDAGCSSFFRIRDGGSSAPSVTSTIVAESQHYFPTASGGGIGRDVISLVAPFKPSAGTHTLALFCQISGGTGIITPIGTRYIYVSRMAGH